MKNLKPLTPTHTTGEIKKALDITSNRSFLTFIFGETGRGKTLTAKHWVADNNGTYVRCMSKCTQPKLSSLIAEATVGNATSNSQLNTKNILNFLLSQDDDYILVIDETNYLLGGSLKNAEDSLNYLRDLQDLTGAGIALIFTNYELNFLYHGKLAGFLEQFIGRMEYNYQIPKRILKTSDVLPILKTYVPNPSQALINKAYDITSAGKGKFRTLVKYLELAKEYSQKYNKPILPAMLDSLCVRYEGGGICPED